MKRLIAYISILAAVLTAGVSCSREDVLDGEQEGGNISLVFKASQMATRVDINENAGKVAGEGAENVIDHVDYFFFADEDPESEAIVSGRLTSADLTKVAEGEYKTADQFIDTATEGYEALKGPSYFYALVNYPEEVTAKTMTALLALPISTDFTKEQTSFVMDSFSSEAESGLIYLTPKSSAEDRTEVVKVSRIAAKLVLNINVAESFEDATHDVWTPVLDQMWVNFLYARKTATVAATPMAFDAKTYYYNTDQAMPNGDGTATDGFYKYTTDPVIYKNIKLWHYFVPSANKYMNVEVSPGETAHQYQYAIRCIIEWLRDGKVVYFHCHGGADRTGTLAFLIEGLLGVSESDMAKDFELTTYSNSIHRRNSDGGWFYRGMVNYIRSFAPGKTIQEQVTAWAKTKHSDEVSPLTDNELKELKELLLE